MKRLISYSIVTLMALMVTACGFHLRGSGEGEMKIKELSVKTDDQYGALQKELREQLTDEGVKLYDMATYHLVVNQSKESRALTYTSAMKGNDTSRTLILNYKIYGPQNMLLIENSVEARGQYLDDSNNIVANSSQVNQLDKEIRGDAITLLMYRLRNITPEQLESLLAKAQENKRLQEEAEKAQQKAALERRKELQNSIPLDQIEKLNDLR